MKELSKIALKVNPSTTLAIDSLAKQMKADGLDVIGFGTGEPDFMTPDNISEAGIAAIHEGKTKYTPAAGIVQLRKAAAERLKADCGLDYDYTQIVIASGAKHNVYIALRALVNPGDEVIVPAPYWVSYCEMVSMCGGVPVVVETTEAADFKMTPDQLEAAITPKTKALMLNNPSNPTGMVYNSDEPARNCRRLHETRPLRHRRRDILQAHVRRKALHQFCQPRRGRQGAHYNCQRRFQELRHDRMAYRICRGQQARLPRVMSNYLSHSTGAPSTISQWAAVEALSGQQETIEDMRKVFEERRNYFVKRLNSIPGVSCIMPEGAFYIMMNIEKLIGRTIGGVEITDDDVFAEAFLKQGLVAVVPCSGFGIKNFVRWTYATSLDNIREGLNRLEKFLAE